MKAKTILVALGIIILIALVIVGLRLQREDAPIHTDPGAAMYGKAADSMASAVAVLNPSGETNAHGRVTFTETDRGLHLVADLRGLKPAPHILTVVRAPSCDSLPEPSAVDESDMKAGETGSEALPPFDFAVAFTPDASGSVSLDKSEADLSLTEDNSIVGYSVVVRREVDPDNRRFQRVACGRVGDLVWTPIRDRGALPVEREPAAGADPAEGTLD